jgi:hypothetical protein
MSLDTTKVGVDEISKAYLEVVRNLLGDNTRLIRDELLVSYRRIIKPPGFEPKDIAPEAQKKLNALAQIADEKESGSHNYPLQFARLLARMEYVQTRFNVMQFLIESIRKHQTRCSQFYKISYQRACPEDYVDNFVSLPEFVIRNAKESARRLPIRVDRTYVDLEPVARFCRGTRENGILKPCEGASEELPFGYPVYDSQERCDTCKKKARYTECLRREPSCDGTQVACGNKSFAGEICNGEFGLYVTRYSDSLKVGQALLINLVSRLLDQGSGSALLIYPILNIKLAYELENALRDFLDASLPEIGHGIKSVTLHSPRTKEKIKEFVENWGRDDRPLLNSLSDMLDQNNFKLNGENIDFSLLDKKVSVFLANYIIPPWGSGVKIKPTGGRIRGKVVGYRGSIIFLDDDKATDMKRLNGYVLKGRVKYE